MRTRQRIWFKIFALILAGGTLCNVGLNCAWWGNQFAVESVNWTWFLTCDTDTLFSGNGILLDCGDSTTTTSTSTSSLI